MAMIKLGAKSNAVKLFQEKLIKLGYSCGEDGADGEFGANTYKAVLQFQKDYNLEVDGVVGPETANALRQAVLKITSSKTEEKIENEKGKQEEITETTEPKQEEKIDDGSIKNGDIGDKVKQLQNMLIELGYSCGFSGADGEFGTNTENAIKQFEKDNKLAQTGIATVNLLKILNDKYEDLQKMIKDPNAINAQKLIAIAKAEIGYFEKATDSQLDNKTANKGDGNWTKYARDLAAAGYYNGSKNGYAWCFTAGTLILTNKGYKKIEDIKVGDKVLNAYGNKFNTVLFNEPHQDKVIDIRIYGALPFSVTPNHPFLSQKRINKFHRNKGYYGYGFNTISSLEKNDVCISPITKIEYDNSLNYDELWTLGYYVGDGYTTHTNRFKICGNADKAKLIRQHVDAKEEIKYNSRTCYEFELYKTNHKELIELLNDCGHLAKNKRVPAKILFGTKEAKKAFLDGYIAADGTKDLKFNSISHELIAGITKLYNDLGYGCSVNIQERPTTGKIWDTRINDYRYFNQQPYIINCTVNYSNANKHQLYSLDEANIYLPLKEKNDIPYQDEVWTISTDGDHTYLANNLAVHNCDVFVDWCFYQLTNKNSIKAQEIQCQTGPLGAACIYSAQYYRDQNRFSTTPQIGDQIFFGTAGNEQHTGIVESVVGNTVNTIEGNSGDQVARRNYQLNSSYIVGYGHPKYPSTKETINPANSIINKKYTWSGDVCITANVLNVRTGPSYDNPIIATVLKDNVVHITEVNEEGNWGHVDGSGWILLDYAKGVG